MKEGKGVLLFGTQEPKISGYLVIGNRHYEIFGQRMSEIRTNLHVKLIGEKDDRSIAAGAGELDCA